MKKNHKLPLSMVLSGGVLLIIILATLLATLSPYDPIAVETGQKFLPPSAQHLLGTCAPRKTHTHQRRARCRNPACS